jgi:hypothetical protein
MTKPLTEAEKAAAAKVAGILFAIMVFMAVLVVLAVGKQDPSGQKADAKAPQTEAEAWNAKANAAARQSSDLLEQDLRFCRRLVDSRQTTLGECLVAARSAARTPE